MLKFFSVLLSLLSLSCFAQCESYMFSETDMIKALDCGFDSTGRILSSTTGGTGVDFYTVSMDGDVIYTGFDNEFENLAGGNYNIIVEDEMGCVIDTNLVIISAPNPYINELGAEPSYCQISSDSSIFYGTVYAGASGGTPSHYYLWESLSTGETTVNSTWGARPSGDYRILITDSNGCIATEVVTVDSVNPSASFDIISDDIWETPFGYGGLAPVSIKCRNTSEGIASPWMLMETEIFYEWQLGNYADWITTTYDEEPEVTFNYENIWGIKLVVETPGGCVDTSHQFIAVFGPLSTENSTNVQSINIIPNAGYNSLTIKKQGFDTNIRVVLYNISGEKLFDHVLTEAEETVPFNMAKGTYIYEFIDDSNSQKIRSGKFIY